MPLEAIGSETVRVQRRCEVRQIPGPPPLENERGRRDDGAPLPREQRRERFRSAVDYACPEIDDDQPFSVFRRKAAQLSAVEPRSRDEKAATRERLIRRGRGGVRCDDREPRRGDPQQLFGRRVR